MKVYIVQMCNYDDQDIYRIYSDYDKAVECMQALNKGRKPYIGHYVVEEHEVVE